MSTLDRLCRALGVSAPALTERILDRWPDSQTVAEHVASGPLPRKTKKQADEWRKTGHPRAFAALASLLPSPDTIASLGIDPGRNGAMVGIDSQGAVVLEVALGSLVVDESLDGPAARKRARAEEQRAIREANKSRPPSRQLKGRRKQVTSMAGARWRLDPMALRWLFEHLRPPRVALEGLLFHGIALRTEEVWQMPRYELAKAINRAREGVKAGATMVANWERLAIALRYAGLDYEEVTPSVWQAGWCSREDADRLFPVEEYGDTWDRDQMMSEPKTRSLAAARLAGYDCGTNDALADAYGLARWGLQ